MPRKRLTLRGLATKSGRDYEEALLLAWEAGFDYITSADTRIKTNDAKKLHALFDVPHSKKIIKKTYWQKALHKNEEQFKALLIDLGFTWNPRATNVPKGSIVKLQREEAKVRDVIREVKSAVPTPENFERLQVPRLEWVEVGHVPPSGEMRFLTTEEVKAVHFELAKDFAKKKDPILPVGVKSEDLLASALYRPQTSYGDSLKYPTIQMAAAALIHSVIHNHPFHNGNKRTALVSMLVMLDENGVIFEAQEDDVFRQIMRIAKHAITNNHPKDRDDREAIEIAHWICTNSRLIQKGELPIQYRKLKSILSGFECEIGDKQKGKIQISRVIRPSGIFSVTRKVTFPLYCRTDGQEIDQVSIAKLRRELELDEAHGVDSTTFYVTGTSIIEGFIQRYRKTLQRLSKL